AAVHSKPLLIRTGFTWSLHARREKRFFSLDRIAGLAERLAYARADAAIVTSDYDAEYIRQSYGIAAEKLNILLNYVDVDFFKPIMETQVYADRLVFVGRLAPQKNLDQ